MGYTNKTSHYELPQYVANDKPSWLGDFNAAMLKIDTAIADTDATAEAANSAATGAQTQVASLSAQLSTIQGQVNTAVDTATAADGKATTAQTIATQANTAAGEAKTLAETAKQSADLALPIGGGTMTGDLILNGAPTADNQAATKAYVDARGISTYSATLTKTSNLTTNSTIMVYRQGDAITTNLVTGTLAGYASDLPAQLDIATVAGNPLNLTENKRYYINTARRVKSGSYDDIVSFSIGYNGTNTILALVVAKAAGLVGATISGIVGLAPMSEL